LSARVHGFLLRRLYPRPDLVVYLDAPGEVLFQRKGEASPDWLEARRRQYLELREAVPHFVTVDAARPVEQVTHEVARIITRFYNGSRR
jgi:thymidylate kinase